VRIEVVDPRDDAAFRQWFGVLQAVEQDTRPGEEGWAPLDQQALAVAGLDPEASGVGEHVVLLVAHEGDEPLGIGRLVMPVRDNTDRARVLVLVHPEHRRRGVGTALLEDQLTRLREMGRTVAAGEVDEPEHLTGRSPGGRFAQRHGFACALVDVRRDLALPADAERLAAVSEQALQAASGYEVRTYRDRCPDDLLEGRVALARAMSVMFPAGDMELEEEVWDAHRLRAMERLHEQQGRHYVGALACRDGEAVAFTELGLNAAQPARAYQWDTLVLPDHRGRRLGTVLKLAALRELEQAWPQARQVTTWNADTNTPMIAVNEALGFRPNGTLATWQKHL
jgi:GNAT superfamily N-acetyltransferase